MKVTERELEMAFTLIELLKKPFDPSEYHDHYREALAQLIDAKLEGSEVVNAPAARETEVIDLADALQAERGGGQERRQAQAGRAAAVAPGQRRRGPER